MEALWCTTSGEQVDKCSHSTLEKNRNEHLEGFHDISATTDNTGKFGSSVRPPKQ